jgi:formylglycine-generating enzyme required for sulfatase activity
MRSFLALLLVVSSGALSQGIEWLPVGAPINDPWPGANPPQTSIGTVFYSYEIAKYETTNAQYADMLNAVAATDANGLWSSNMEFSAIGGIERLGTPGSYTYSVKLGFENMPVIYVSFYDAIRFANWHHNGKPIGAQDNSTTEDGAYTITVDGINNNTIVRNSSALYALPTRDEWAKAGYYDTDNGIWYLYPAQSQSPMTLSVPALDTGNNGNCNAGASVLYDVGSYVLSESPNGTFDQGGNLAEWTETIGPSARKWVGSSFGGSCNGTIINSAVNLHPLNEVINGGFRLVQPGAPPTNVPIPTWALIALGVLITCGTSIRARR